MDSRNFREEKSTRKRKMLKSRRQKEKAEKKKKINLNAKKMSKRSDNVCIFWMCRFAWVYIYFFGV